MLKKMDIEVMYLDLFIILVVVEVTDVSRLCTILVALEVTSVLRNCARFTWFFKSFDVDNTAVIKEHPIFDKKVLLMFWESTFELPKKNITVTCKLKNEFLRNFRTERFAHLRKKPFFCLLLYHAQN